VGLSRNRLFTHQINCVAGLAFESFFVRLGLKKYRAIIFAAFPACPSYRREFVVNHLDYFTGYFITVIAFYRRFSDDAVTF